MVWTPTTYSLLGFGAAGISTLAATQAWWERDERGARPFIGLMLALGGWSLVYAIQLGFTSQTGQLFWQRASLAIGGTVPTLWLLFILQYTGRDSWLTRSKHAALAIDPLLFALLTFTNPLHGLIWESATLTSTVVGPVLQLSFGIGYYVHIGYAYLVVATGLGLLVRMSDRASPIYQRQTSFLILGALPPFAAHIAYTLRVTWGPLPALDPTPFVFVITGLLFSLALFKFDLLERTPIARQRALDEMGEGLLVLDAAGRVVNVNSRAQQALDPSPTVGYPITEIGPDEAETVDEARERLDGQTITAAVDGRERAYDVDWSSLADEQGTTVGHVISLRDVTSRNEYEQRLEVAQRVLRHNLRNDMQVVQGWADYLAEQTTDQEAMAAEQISDTATELIDLSEKVHTMVRMDELAATKWTSIDVRKQLASLVTEFEEEHPDVDIACEIPAAVKVRLPDETFLAIPVRNLIENAIEHNDRDTPWVRIRVESADRCVWIHIEDNGPTIPAMERKVLEEGTEDTLQHGSGVGLWLTYWSVKAVGGNITFDTREPRGNIVTLRFPEG